MDYLYRGQSGERRRRIPSPLPALLVVVVATVVLSLGLGAPALAQIELNSSEIPGSVVVFPKFVRGTVEVGRTTPAPGTPILEPRSAFSISVTCPTGSRCAEGERVKLRARWICPATQDPTQKLVCRSTDFELSTTVKGTLWFNPENAGTRTIDVARPSCTQGYLLVWVISPDDADAPRAIKFDGLLGIGMLRGSDATLSAYNAYPIQAISRLATQAPTDANNDGRLQFDGATEYKAVTGQVRGTVRFERASAIPNTDVGPINTSLTLLTLDTNANRPNFPTFVDLHFFNEDERLLSTSHEFICWSQVRLTTIDANLDEFFGQKGLVESTEAEKVAIFGISDTPGPVTLIGIAETVERDATGADQRQYSYTLYNDGRPISAARVVQVVAPTSGEAISGPFPLQAVAQDGSGAAIQRVEFYVDTDSAPVCSDFTTRVSGSTFQCTWNSGTRPSGPHTVRARATSTTGQTFDSTVVAFTISPDTTAPTGVQVLTPSGGQVLTGTVVLQARAEDDSDTIQRIEFFLDTGTSPLCADATPKSSGATFQCTWNPAGTPDGLHGITARAYDQAGNSADSPAVAITVSYTHTLAVSVTGSGVVRSTPTGIDCGGSCAASFDYGRQVTLVPTPAGGWRFTGWSGACTGSGPCTVTMESYVSVAATFVREIFRLSVSASGSGTVTSTAAAINCPPACTADLPSGTPVSLAVTPAADAVFTGWSGACTGSGPCAVTMNGNVSAAAAFVRVTFRLSVSVSGGGTVTSAPAAINCPPACTADFPSGTPVSLTVTPAADAIFSGWGGDCSGSGACAVTMSANRGVRAELRTIDITPVATFVRDLYRDILGRVPGEDEIATWIALLRSASTPAVASEMIHGFFDSAENLNRPTTLARYVRLLYVILLGREPSPPEVDVWVAAIVQRFNLLIPGFVNSPEFMDLSQRTPPEVVVRRLYEQTLHRSPSDAEVAPWVDALNQNGLDWVAIATGFLNSPEYLNTPRSFGEHVRVLYRTFLGREPAAAEVDGWLGVLVGYLRDIQDGFINSPEFMDRMRALLG